MLPELNASGLLPPGIHAASLAEVLARFGEGSAARERQAALLTEVVNAAKLYATVKRVLVWGSFVTAKPEPRDIDFSLVTDAAHRDAAVLPEHRRYLVALEARIHYGVDRGFLLISDYPPDRYAERVDFMCRDRYGAPHGIVEISLRGEEVSA